MLYTEDAQKNRPGHKKTHSRMPTRRRIPRQRSAKVSQLPNLNQPWYAVRHALVTFCGIMPSRPSVDKQQSTRHAQTFHDDDIPTQHCFADDTHLECCQPPPTSYHNTNHRGLAPGISRANRLPLEAYSGRWCTCLSGEVCSKQFGVTPRWVAVWLPPDFRTLGIIRNQRLLHHGRPTGSIPPKEVREASWRYFAAIHPEAPNILRRFRRTRTTFSKKKTKHLRSRRSSIVTPRKPVRGQDIRRLPLCTSLDAHEKKQPSSSHHDVVPVTGYVTWCRRPRTLQPMAFPRRFSRHECRTARRVDGTYCGFTMRASCAAFDPPATT